MSAKLLHTLSDENPDLQKQIGCMNGIFQLFDRHHFLGGRRINGHTHKRLPPVFLPHAHASIYVFRNFSRQMLLLGWAGQSLDLRDIVKDSIYREACGLSVKTAWKKEAVSHAVKHIDSPRPMRLSKEPIKKGNGNSSKMLSPQQEPGSNKRPSGVVAKLMGLDAFPDSSMSINDGQMEACPDGDTNPFSRSSKAAGRKQAASNFWVPKEFPQGPRFHLG
ncbi:Protein LONGIFOLIA 1 [Vitis vinifera]|uniref:Protein LONGIFOLIA 1 n=1 Tax=Vitis vinifera TaxID=29760 RepID=A0A438D7L2_VITVI|nr:Protein LONGIFOLIA 1 [Vitis vinifera]